MSDIEDNIEEDYDLPPEVIEQAAQAQSRLMPVKSAAIYEKTYKLFCDWRNKMSVRKTSEQVLMAYLNEKSKQVKPSSLWSYFSMLKKVLKVKEKVDISKYASAQEFLKNISRGYRPKKSKVLSKENVMAFLKEADDFHFLFAKIYQSNSREVTLRDVERETSGEFKCEVSEDAPIFHTEIRAAHLLVADIPDEEPVLRTEVQKTAPDTKIRANCTTPGSYPPMNVTWFINDVEMRPKYKVQLEEAINRYEALNDLDTVTSKINISINDNPDLFKNGKMKLRCVATLYTLYRRSKEVDIQEDAPRLALIMVPTTHSNEGIDAGFRNSSSPKFLHHSAFTYILVYAITRLLVR